VDETTNTVDIVGYPDEAVSLNQRRNEQRDREQTPESFRVSYARNNIIPNYLWLFACISNHPETRTNNILLDAVISPELHRIAAFAKTAGFSLSFT